jgi:2'-5' RNA ligase
MAGCFQDRNPAILPAPGGCRFGARGSNRVNVQEPRARGISLWLMPGAVARRRLAALIERLAARLGTAPFPPHLTLLPGIEDGPDEVLAAAGPLAAGLRPLTVRLESVEGREEPFRCLVALAAADEPLRAAHAAAARAFGRQPDPVFLPHVSLVYGSLAPETKSELIRDVASSAVLACEAARLHVWRTEGPVGDWREIGAFDLGPAPRP